MRHCAGGGGVNNHMKKPRPVWPDEAQRRTPTEGYDMNTITTSNALAAGDLHVAADWLARHPDLPPIFAIHRHESGVQITFRVTTDADAEALIALTDDDGWRSDHHYDDGTVSRIMDGRLGGDRLRLSVAVDA